MSGCGKRRFDTKLDAMLALSRCVSKNGKCNRWETRYYYCERCGAWHLTKEREGVRLK